MWTGHGPKGTDVICKTKRLQFSNKLIQGLIIVARCIFIIKEKWLMIKIHGAFLLLRLRMSLIVYTDYETVTESGVN
jgi:hypothetical protein